MAGSCVALLYPVNMQGLACAGVRAGVPAKTQSPCRLPDREGGLKTGRGGKGGMGGQWEQKTMPKDSAVARGRAGCHDVRHAVSRREPFALRCRRCRRLSGVVGYRAADLRLCPAGPAHLPGAGAHWHAGRVCRLGASCENQSAIVNVQLVMRHVT